ncbi:MAG: ribonuclease P protein subunit [Candidatus Diapherotrites archaeon]
MLKGENWTITKENIMMHEMIGLKVRIRSPNMQKKIVGKVVDETKNMFIVEIKNREIKVPKQKGIFEFFLGDEIAKVEGDKIRYLPEQRVKRC